MNQFPSHSYTCTTHSLFLVFDPLGTCPTVSRVTHKDHGETRVVLAGSTACSYVNPLPAAGMWLIWPLLPLASLHTSAALLAVDSLEYFYHLLETAPHPCHCLIVSRVPQTLPAYFFIWVLE